MTRTVFACSLALGLTAPAWAQEPSPPETLESPCVAVARPVVTLPDGSNPAELSATTQQALVEALVEQGVAARRAEADAQPEGAAGECATQVVTRLTIKRKGGPSWVRRALTDAAIATVWQAPVRGLGGVAATAAAGSGLQALAAASTVAKAHDEVAFTYGATVSGQPALREATTRVKVETDAADVFSPLVAGAAKAIAASLKPAGSRR